MTAIYIGAAFIAGWLLAAALFFIVLICLGAGEDRR